MAKYNWRNKKNLSRGFKLYTQFDTSAVSAIDFSQIDTDSFSTTIEPWVFTAPGDGLYTMTTTDLSGVVTLDLDSGVLPMINRTISTTREYERGDVIEPPSQWTVSAEL